MWSNEYYGQKPKFTVSGLILRLSEWTFSYGAEFPTDLLFKSVNIPAGEIKFTTDPLFDKQATLYVVPTKTISPEFPVGSNYYITEFGGDPAKGEIANPPDERWTAGISVVPCLNIAIKAGAVVLEVTANEFDVGEIPNPRREIQTKTGQVKAWRKGKQPEGWELLDAHKHKKAFPISLGRLKRGENWYVEVPV